ncbi:DNA replication complex GINS protein PSF2-like [Convolutriloba macropyga]|uniref:DNA replication complex GINS protein PSF2-like n=1 Tax=Convolutriloba macropyga TaxID=536237 RepID=UPI003F521AE1
MELLDRLHPCELEFLAEDSLITVVPKLNQEQLFLIVGDFGPFVAGLPCEVPLWLAVHLSKKRLCEIRPPAWLTTEKLAEWKQQEVDSPEVFHPMLSPIYMEVSHLLLTNALDSIPHADQVRTLVKDIWDIRTSKLRSSIDKFIKDKETFAGLNNLSVMEINFIRPLLVNTLDNMNAIRFAEQAE